MNPASTELPLRVNGIQAAFGVALGQESPRTDEGPAAYPYRRMVATSGLLNTGWSWVTWRCGRSKMNA
jgi:hypothetical protein